jgi:hypothetical protein
MKRLRLSIASLMALIAYAALGLAAFGKVNDPFYGRLWDDAYYMVTVFILAIASMRAALVPGRGRARWLGFAVFGWVHLLFGWPDSGGSPQSPGTYRPRFPHATLINWVLFSYYAPDESHLKPLMDLARSWLAAPAHRQYETFVWHDIQTSLTMATALIGSVVGHLLAIRLGRDASDALEPGAAGR